MVLPDAPYLPKEVSNIRPLVEITGDMNGGFHDYTVYCRDADCGLLTPLSEPQSIIQAGLVRDRHLAEHLTAIAKEMKEAAR